MQDYLRQTPIVGLAAIVIALVLPSAAGAGVPHKDYGCYGEGSLYIGTLKIKSAKAYNYLGENGKYRFRKASKTLTFKSGSLKPWVGHLQKANGEPAIKLVTDKHGGQTVDCY